MTDTNLEQVKRFIDIVSYDGEVVELNPGQAMVYRLPNGKIAAYSRGVYHFHAINDPASVNALDFANKIGLSTNDGLVGMNPAHGTDIHFTNQISASNAIRVDNVDILINNNGHHPGLFLSPADCNGVIVSLPGAYGLIHAGRDGLGMNAVSKGFLTMFTKWAEQKDEINLNEITIVLPPQVAADNYVMANDNFRTKEGSWWAQHPELTYQVAEGWQLDIEKGSIIQLGEAISNYIAQHPEKTFTGKITMLCSTLYTGIESGFASHSEAQRLGTADEKQRNLVIVGQV